MSSNGSKHTPAQASQDRADRILGLTRADVHANKKATTTMKFKKTSKHGDSDGGDELAESRIMDITTFDSSFMRTKAYNATPSSNDASPKKSDGIATRAISPPVRHTNAISIYAQRFSGLQVRA
jgi:hypothetical protein